MTQKTITVAFDLYPTTLAQLLHVTAVHLPTCTGASIDVLVFLALNELSLGRLISHSAAKDWDALVPTLFPNESFDTQEMLKHTCLVLSGMIYKQFFDVLERTRLPTPAQLVRAEVSHHAVTFTAICYEEPRPCDWLYSTTETR